MINFEAYFLYFTENNNIIVENILINIYTLIKLKKVKKYY